MVAKNDEKATWMPLVGAIVSDTKKKRKQRTDQRTRSRTSRVFVSSGKGWRTSSLPLRDGTLRITAPCKTSTPYAPFPPCPTTTRGPTYLYSQLITITVVSRRPAIQPTGPKAAAAVQHLPLPELHPRNAQIRPRAAERAVRGERNARTRHRYNISITSTYSVGVGARRVLPRRALRRPVRRRIPAKHGRARRRAEAEGVREGGRTLGGRGGGDAPARGARGGR